MTGLRPLVGSGENDVEQAGEGRIERLAAQHVHMRDPLVARVHQPGLPQHPELVRHGRFRASAVQSGATIFPFTLKLQDDPKPDRIAEGMQNFLKA